uniref:LysM domain-containing protein n=1 Tax=Kalanchoe fedtschenkoi TaxID=63787 RepID=A0A7N0VBP8_KALFE
MARSKQISLFSLTTLLLSSILAVSAISVVEGRSQMKRPVWVWETVGRQPSNRLEDLKDTRGSEIPNCNLIFSVRSGDICFKITQQLNLTTAFFQKMNPNLVCERLFVGEWVCIGESAN